MISLFLEQIVNLLNFTLKSVRQSSLNDIKYQKLIIWQDSNGPLEISCVNVFGTDVYRLSHGDHIAVDILPERELLVRSQSDFPQITIDHFLADQVLPRVISHYGEFVLHAGALCSDDCVILLLGKSGNGKSTLAASFRNTDWMLLGDDAIVISQDERGPLAISVYPSLRLFPDSIAALLPEDGISEDIAHYSAKQRLSLPIASTIETNPAPIKAIFVLDDISVPHISLTRHSIAKSCMALLENSFSLDPTDLTAARSRLDVASSLARQVPTFALSYPRDYARLPEVRAAMLNELKGL